MAIVRQDIKGGVFGSSEKSCWEETIMPIERINPSNLSQSGGYHHVVKDGKTVYVAGQVSRDKDGTKKPLALRSQRPYTGGESHPVDSG